MWRWNSVTTRTFTYVFNFYKDVIIVWSLSLTLKMKSPEEMLSMCFAEQFWKTSQHDALKIQGCVIPDVLSSLLEKRGAVKKTVKKWINCKTRHLGKLMDISKELGQLSSEATENSCQGL
ncbi:hypothetical protein Y1Q_0000614 [Alligator mississippiensis]|uniref:Uncharacterized protein n=1 Tax=Alligator mississippiensis TaxID=8496 RepID=A0A151MBS3_ALLMI|nr:hypothetical protein Y1Q_0000614 [Alligator mississippiensis]